MWRRDCSGRIVFCSLAHADARSEELSNSGRPCRDLLCHWLRRPASFWRWLWHYLELPEPSARLRSITNAFVAVAGLVVVITFLWRARDGKTRFAPSMSMPPVETAHPLKVCAIALITFVGALGPGAAVRARDPLPFLAHSALHSEKGCKCRRRACWQRLLFWSIANNLLDSHGFSCARFLLPRI